MNFFDKYKLIDIDYSMFNKEYKKEDYLWDVSKDICPKDRFFFIKAFSFTGNEKVYIKTMEYISVHPTDIFTIYDFYQSNYHKKNDISYILSNQEIEKFIELNKKRNIIYLSNKFFNKSKIKKFLLFVNEETHERIFEIVHSSTIEDLNNYINKKKISSFYVKLSENVKDMKNIVKSYYMYINNNIKQEEKNEIIDFVKGLSIQSNYLNKPLIKLILEKAYEIAMSSENITLNEAKKELLIKYLNYFKQYSEDREDQYELDENGIYFENVLNDITLFRHSKEYIKTILDESYNMYQKDLKDINDEFIKVQEEINEY